MCDCTRFDSIRLVCAFFFDEIYSNMNGKTQTHIHPVLQSVGMKFKLVFIWNVSKQMEYGIQKKWWTIYMNRSKVKKMWRKTIAATVESTLKL